MNVGIRLTLSEAAYKELPNLEPFASLDCGMRFLYERNAPSQVYVVVDCSRGGEKCYRLDLWSVARLIKQAVDLGTLIVEDEW